MITASIVGATGYTGMVLTELLARHPQVRLQALTSTSYRGRQVQEVFPHVRAVEAEYVEYSAEAVDGSEVAFVCYPHAEAHPVVAELAGRGVRVIDLSADFRLRALGDYEKWYGFRHGFPDLVAEAVYGLPELYREQIRTARVVANPGCYPTSVILAVAPLADKLAPAALIVDSKSGVSGAGRTANDKTHFCSVHDNFKAYSEVGHRHTAEMIQEISRLAGREVALSFTPHLLPVDRGILSVVYVQVMQEEYAAVMPSQGELLRLYRDFYAEEPFVEVVEHAPSLREVQWTNVCRMTVRVDALAGVIKIISVIDNLVKGASGQAVQNMNIMFGCAERTGLEAKV